VLSHQRMAQFVQYNRTEHDRQKCSATPWAYSISRQLLISPNKNQQQQERKMNSDFDSENSPRVNGPGPHLYSLILYG
jgi:hypothetical protein